MLPPLSRIGERHTETSSETRAWRHCRRPAPSASGRSEAAGRWWPAGGVGAARQEAQPLGHCADAVVCRAAPVRFGACSRRSLMLTQLSVRLARPLVRAKRLCALQGEQHSGAAATQHLVAQPADQRASRAATIATRVLTRLGAQLRGGGGAHRR